MKQVFVLILLPFVMLLGVGCSQELLDQLLQKESDSGTEVSSELLAELVGHVLFDSVNEVFEAAGLENLTSNTSAPFNINRFSEENNVQETGNGNYNFELNPNSGMATFTATVQEFKIDIVNTVEFRNDQGRLIATLAKGGTSRVTN
ncbi:MAG: hypothetical protein SNJ78_05525 [Spirochaetales bacterium]